MSSWYKWGKEFREGLSIIFCHQVRKEPNDALQKVPGEPRWVGREPQGLRTTVLRL